MPTKYEESEFIITIDGPAASGKTSVAKDLAQKLGYIHLVGGTFFRSFAYFVICNHVDPNNEGSLIELLQNFKLETTELSNLGDYEILINGIPSSQFLWTPAVDAVVSFTSRPKAVRERRIEWKRTFAKGKRIVADGRTLGSEVFPWATLKIYLTASIEERASRRFHQLNKENSTIEEIRSAIILRDLNDKTGSIDRTSIQSDQIIIDSSDLTHNQVVNEIYRLATQN